MSGAMRNAGLTAGPSPHAAGASRHVSTWMLGACGIWLVGLGLYFILALHSDFRWLLLLPALVWLAGLFVYRADRGAASIDTTMASME